MNPSGWRPTTSLVRAVLSATTLAVLAVVTGRPDLLVLATPLLVHAVAGARRPRTVPRVASELGTSVVREGAGTGLRVRVSHAEGVEHAVVALNPHPHVATRPASGVTGTSAVPDGAVGADGGAFEAHLDVAGLRWGRRRLGDGQVVATSTWSGYRWGPAPLAARDLTVLPVPGIFDSRAPSPHPVGLVGQHPASRRGDGSEFESVRPYRPGDRLRRIRWQTSLRTGSLHVTTTVAEEDAGLLLLVDAAVEVGLSGGVHGRSSTLDVAVRAAAAVAEHYLGRGDRVGLRVLGPAERSVVPVAAGGRHLRRLLDTLARVRPGEDGSAPARPLRLRAPAGTIVVVLSPLLSQTSVAATTTLAARGLDVVVVDCLPEDLDVARADATDAAEALAWRMRLLERDLVVERVARRGVPVVAWRGPGTLDEVLRRLSRRPARPAAGHAAPLTTGRSAGLS